MTLEDAFRAKNTIETDFFAAFARVLNAAERAPPTRVQRESVLPSPDRGDRDDDDDDDDDDDGYDTDRGRYRDPTHEHRALLRVFLCSLYGSSAEERACRRNAVSRKTQSREVARVGAGTPTVSAPRPSRRRHIHSVSFSPPSK